MLGWFKNKTPDAKSGVVVSNPQRAPNKPVEGLENSENYLRVNSLPSIGDFIGHDLRSGSPPKLTSWV